MFKTRHNLAREDSLAAVPIRAAAKIEPTESGARLIVELSSPRWGRWLFRYPAGATKKFELDAVGLFVWESCDGDASVRQIIRKLARRYNLNLREAEVSTTAFLQTLVKKGLIAMKIGETTDERG